MDKQELKEKLISNGLEKYFAKLEPLFRNTIRLYQTATEENLIKIGQTKIGGQPDLPKSIRFLDNSCG